MAIDEARHHKAPFKVDGFGGTFARQARADLDEPSARNRKVSGAAVRQQGIW
ncbi:hypothetical protein [Novosphingobium sp. ST904]|uniref:hypothetical protein n=1 Tax=Novosphingobium sp. ST904 TaxID=1684385 RepID=UPI001E543F45|nr:hypothetical protein [Novosphingobium sp. ST904]